MRKQVEMEDREWASEEGTRSKKKHNTVFSYFYNTGISH
jgi:hypothetical protein